MKTPGLLAVTVRPGWNTDDAIFQDWYNHEQGPLRMRLPFVEAGARYESEHGDTEETQHDWMALYDVTDLDCLNDRMYTRLEAESSLRSKAVMGTFESYERKIYHLLSTRGKPGLHATTVLAVSVQVNAEDEIEYNRWHECECPRLVAQLPGFVGMKRFQQVVDAAAPQQYLEQLTLCYFDSDDEQRPEAQQGLRHVFDKCEPAQKPLSRTHRTWLHRRDLQALPEPPSTIVTTDGAELEFRLEGNPRDPVVVCINSMLTSFHMWDDVAHALIARGLNGQTYRVLRYNPRGYLKQRERSNHTDFGLLAADLEYLLQRLHIARAKTVVGAKLGGVVALSFALKFPHLVESYVACDCGVVSNPITNQAWAERVHLVKSSGMSILAEMIVPRWFLPANQHSPAARKIAAMIAQADFSGFEQNSLNLCNYDLHPLLPQIQVPGLLVAGEHDDRLLEHMRSCEIPLSRFTAIPAAKALPMLENREAFLQEMAAFLKVM